MCAAVLTPACPFQATPLTLKLFSCDTQLHRHLWKSFSFCLFFAGKFRLLGAFHLRSLPIAQWLTYLRAHSSHSSQAPPSALLSTGGPSGSALLPTCLLKEHFLIFSVLSFHGSLLLWPLPDAGSFLMLATSQCWLLLHPCTSTAHPVWLPFSTRSEQRFALSCATWKLPVHQTKHTSNVWELLDKGWFF